jgi:hypothetical protein
MNFKKIFEDKETYNYTQRVIEKSTWKKWKPHYVGNVGLLGIESVLTPKEITEATAYGDPLIELKVERGKLNSSGQIKIIEDAKARKPEAMNYLWLQFQNITRKGIFPKLGSLADRKKEKNYDKDIWTDWLGIAWADLFNKDNIMPAKEIAGVSALDGFELGRSEPGAALNNLANRFALLLKNSADMLWTDEITKGLTKVPGDTVKDIKQVKLDDHNIINNKLPVENISKETSLYTDLSNESQEFENIYKSSKEINTFLTRFKNSLNSQPFNVKLSNGDKISKSLIYLLGEQDNISNSISDIQRKFEKKDSSKIREFLSNLPSLLKDFNIDKEDFLMYAEDEVVLNKMKNLIKDIA